VGTTRTQGKREIAAEAWGTFIRVGMSQRHRFFRVLQEFTLTFGDFRALTVLDSEVPRPMGVLAHAWECDASNATWIVDRLEERGLVERRPVPGDRRVKAIVLSPQGVKMKAELFERLHEPPPEVLALDRQTLVEIRDALAKLPPSLWATQSPSHPYA
jgi:DNA-binding MarR family transcriptional regulator